EGKNPEIELEGMKRTEQSKAITVQELFPDFMKRHGALRSKSMQRSYRISLKNVCRCQSIANVPIGSITKSQVHDYMQARMNDDGVSASTVNKDAAFLKCLMSKAVEWEVLEHNPLKGMKLFPESGKRDVFLSPEQAALLIQELSEPIGNIVEFAIYTGFRKENILGLKISSIRFHDLTSTGEVELVVKGGKRELFPLSPQAVKVAKRAMGNRRDGYVFINPVTGSRYSSIHKGFDCVVRRLDLKIANDSKLRFHDLRHIFATWLHKQGVSLDILRFLLGHKERSTTDRYTSVDRLNTGKVLELIPDLRELALKKNVS
ncbi:tyrosine-type recombinase/integrase, partial [Candidatus Latescibacterota bacterium]